MLLFALTSLLGLSATVFTVRDNPFSWHDLVLIGGGLFLIAKATHEMHAEIDLPDEAAPAEEKAPSPAVASMGLVIVPTGRVDLVFSDRFHRHGDRHVAGYPHHDRGDPDRGRHHVCGVGPAARFVAEHPTTRMLALAFLLLIGVALVADGFDFHIPRGYIYFAMAFAAAVEAFNVMAARKRRRRPGKQVS